VARLFPTSTQPKLTYRIAFQLGSAEHPASKKVRLLDSMAVAADPIPETHRLRKAGVVEQGATLLSFNVPEILGDNSFFQRGTITVIGCNGAEVEFIGHLRTMFSNRAWCLGAAALVTIIVYILVAMAVANYENKIRNPKISRFRFLDPVVLASGPNAKGSTSRIQILFFSSILFALLLYILLRVGLLSDMSETVLLLLGISGVGAAAAKGSDTQRKRLSFENWAWLVNKRWLPEFGEASKNVAKWRDVVTGADGFDVYNFQMLIFSLVVGVALLQVGFTDLASFKVPEELLAVLGLSQAIYIGGKLTEPASFGDLDDALNELRKLEDTFAAAAVAVPLAVPAAGAAPDAAVAARPDYLAFTKKRDLATTMFESLYGRLDAAANKEPRYR
jgi:hypothetical protein